MKKRGKKMMNEQNKRNIIYISNLKKDIERERQISSKPPIYFWEAQNILDVFLYNEIRNAFNTSDFQTGRRIKTKKDGR